MQYFQQFSSMESNDVKTNAKYSKNNMNDVKRWRLDILTSKTLYNYIIHNNTNYANRIY